MSTAEDSLSSSTGQSGDAAGTARWTDAREDEDAKAVVLSTPPQPLLLESPPSSVSPFASSDSPPSSSSAPPFASTLMATTTSNLLPPRGKGGVAAGVVPPRAAKDTSDLPGTTTPTTMHSSSSSSSSSSAPVRARANTAPATVAPGAAGTATGTRTGTGTVIVTATSMMDSPPTVGAVNETVMMMRMASTVPASGSSPASPAASTAEEGNVPVTPAAVERTSSSDDDEEIRMARAMALAIANNPHLPPEEIRELVGAPRSVLPGSGTTTTATASATTAAAAAQLSTRFSSMFQDFDNLIKTGVANAATASQSASASITPMTASFRLGDNLRKYVGSASASVAVAAAATANSGNEADAANPSGLEPPSTEGAGSAGAQAAAEAVLSTATMAVSTTTATYTTVTAAQVRTATVSEVPSPKRSGGGPSTSVVAAAPTTATATTTAGATTKEGTGGTGASRPRHPFRKQSNRSPCTVPADSIVIERQAIQTTLSEVTSAEPETVVRSDSRAPSPASASAVMNFLPASFRSAVAGANSKKSAKVSAPIRLSSLAWKRRGGMGKYSNLAWELRRIELVNTRILYYRNDSEDDNSAGHLEGNNQHPNSVRGGDAFSLASEDQNPEAVIVSRRANWLEHAASTWTAPTANDITSPRGYIDLAKEKAVVNASYGDSGAPSPFAISVKVRGETKWKLCFSTHRTMMQWLAALTDVVVQASVDAYNASLLAAADPANIAAAEANPLFAAPSPPAPPPNPTGGPSDPHRLWMMEPYRIESGGPAGVGSMSDNYASAERSAAMDDLGLKFDGSDSLPDEDRVETNVSTVSLTVTKETATQIKVSVQPTEADAALARETAKEECERAWSIPERSLMNVGIVVNLALCYVRSSTTTIEAFWYIVVATNVALLLFMTHEPKWDNVLERVWGEPSALQVYSSEQDVSAPIKGSTEMKVDKEAVGKVSVKLKKDFVPVAGSTTVKLKNPRDPSLNSQKQPFAGWCAGSPEIMLVRSHGYLDTKAKIPSPGQLYECVGVDIFESPQRYPDMGSRVKLPPTKFADTSGKKTWRMPDIFIVSIALPTDPPKFGRSSSDGGGYTVTVYFRMTEETRSILRRVTADGYDPNSDKPSDPQTSKVNAVRLMEEWCRRAPTDPKYQARFKVVPNAHNLDEIGMPTWISKYNGKPFLVKRAGQTGFLYNHPELSCMEFDVSLHPFPYLAKQAICFMKESYFKRILVSFGFCIEGRSDDEVRLGRHYCLLVFLPSRISLIYLGISLQLPECLIGSMQLCYPDPGVAIQGADFFSGRSPSSFD
jgi:Protein ENHANCED DISEASE RESISTANCE 2, C-terminal